jgi:Trk K+ transport system NAD-binding subunit
MPRYISQHTIACMTRQALEKLIAELRRDETVKCVRFVSDSLEAKLLCELEAKDKDTVIAFLNAHNMNPQWVMRVEQEW